MVGKAKKYADLDRPLVIALGTYIWDRDLWHSTNALYGNAAVTWWENADGTRGHAETRQPDGFFGVPQSWANEQVAAILHVNQLQPHHLHRAEVTLWPHPASPHRWDALAKMIPDRSTFLLRDYCVCSTTSSSGSGWWH